MSESTSQTQLPISKTPSSLFDRWLAAFVLCGIAGLVFFACKYQDSFPSASIDMKVDKNKVSTLSREWVKTLGYPADGAIEATIFDFDDYGKMFLEHELGQARANELMRGRLPIWSWSTRFCKPYQIEQASVELGLDGKLIGVHHAIENERALPSLQHAEAEKMAREFVQRDAKRDLTGWTLVNDTERQELKRRDHTFVWEDRRTDFGGAHERVWVGIAGNTTADFSHYLHVPETFQRRYNEIRSYNELLKNASAVIYGVIMSAVSFVFIWAFIAGRLRFKLAFFCTGLFAAISICDWANGLQSMMYYYSPLMSYEGFLFDKVISLFSGLISSGVSVFLTIGACESLYRYFFPEKVAMEKWFTVEAMRGSQIFKGLVVGLALFGVHTAWVVAYYILGRSVGIWSPLQFPSDVPLSNYIPAFSAFSVGMEAAFSEELLYRVVALCLFQKVTRNFWLANLLQAASWAFMHSDYPQEPSWARGLELTVVGVTYGWVLRRFGLLPCMVGHFTYDVLMGINPIISSGTLLGLTTSAAAIVPPFVLLGMSGWWIARKGALLESEAILNSGIPIKRPNVAEAAAEPKVEFRYVSPPMKIVAAIFAAGVLLFSTVFLTPPHSVAQLVRLRATRDQAIANARQYLIDHGLSPEGKEAVASLASNYNMNELQYIYEKVSFSKTAELAKVIDPLLWRVRFFKPMDPEEFWVTLDAAGKPISVSETEAEDAKGEKLDQQQAEQRVKRFLEQEHPEFKNYELVDSSKEEQKNRIDYSFSYKVPTMKVAEADFKVYSGTVGGYVSGFGTAWQIPDQWLLERNKIRWNQQAAEYARGFVGLVGSIFGMWWFIILLRSGVWRWKVPIIAGCAMAMFFVIGRLNDMPSFMSWYRTDVPLNSFYMDTAVRTLTGLFMAASLTTFLVGVVLASYRKTFPDLPLEAIFTAVFTDPKWKRRALWRDGILIGTGWSLMLAGIVHLLDVLTAYASPGVPFGPYFSTNFAMVLSAPLDVLFEGIIKGLTYVGGITVATGLAKRFAPQRWKLLLILLLVPCVYHLTDRYWQNFLIDCFDDLLCNLIGFFMVTRVAKMNPVAYFMCGYSQVCIASIYSIFKVGMPTFTLDAIGMCLVAALPVCYMLWLQLSPEGDDITQPLVGVSNQ